MTWRGSARGGTGTSSVTLHMALLRRVDADVAGTNVPAPVTPVRPLSTASVPCQKLLLRMQCAWKIEVAFYNAKQFLGLEDPQNRTPQAVRRTAPLALYLHTLVILWFAKHGRFDAEAYRRAHPWYLQKRTPSFADMLVCLRTASMRETISRYPGQKPPSAKKLLPLFQALEAAA